MDKKNIFPYGVATVGRTQGYSELDYVKDGTLYKGGGSAAVMVESSSDLDDINGPPGKIAYTAGFASMWQMAADGTWVEI